MFSKCIAYLCLTTLPLVIHYFIKHRYRKLRLRNMKNNDKDYYYQCLFFGFKNFDCRQHVIDGIECGEDCSARHVSTILLNVHRELVKAQERGVTVRIILDIEMIGEGCRRFERFSKSGVQIKTQKSDGSYLHHKFCLIDAKEDDCAKVFFGSLNFTLQGVVKNFENIIFTNDKNIVQSFSEEFEELWNIF